MYEQLLLHMYITQTFNCTIYLSVAVLWQLITAKTISKCSQECVHCSNNLTLDKTEQHSLLYRACGAVSDFETTDFLKLCHKTDLQ